MSNNQEESTQLNGGENAAENVKAEEMEEDHQHLNGEQNSAGENAASNQSNQNGDQNQNGSADSAPGRDDDR